MPFARALGASIAVAGTAGALMVAVATTAAADPSTLLVGNPARCAGAQYTTISAAVAAASPGDTIKVCAGVYGEHVDISTPDLTLQGYAAGQTAIKRTGKASTISNANGAITIEASANNTTIDGFTLQDASANNSDGVADFAGSSGLTLVNNIIKLNGNGINLQNPDASMPALIQGNAFLNNNAGGDPGENPETGTGVFISNGPANNTTIVANEFSQDSQTAINFAGDASRPSVGLLVENNQSLNDSTFVVATHSSGAVIQNNTITTNSASVPGTQGHGTGILDFGANTSLRIYANKMTATGPSQSSGISVSANPDPSAYTNVVNNHITGWYNDIKVVTGNTSAYVAGNTLASAGNDGIVVQSGVSGVVISNNRVTSAALYSCEDDTTGNRTAGTANTWTRNSGSAASSPVGICS